MRNLKSLLLTTAVMLLGLSSCTDWDQVDPPAGSQVYPKLEQLGAYHFDDGTPVNSIDVSLAGELLAYDAGDLPVFKQTASRSSMFMDLNGGYLRLQNPVGGNAQQAVSLVFFVYTDVTKTKDISELTLFSFKNEDGSQEVSLDGNGGLHVNTTAGQWEYNTESKTGILQGDTTWHKVAVCISDVDYFIYVDGLKRLDFTPPTSYKTSANLNMKEVVKFMADAPYLYIGNSTYDATANEEKAAAYTWKIDDIDVYRNVITEKQWRWNNSGGGGGGGDDNFEYVIGDWKSSVGNPDNSSGFWGDHSNYFRIPADGSIVLNFKNYSSTANNWNNWVLGITTDDDREGSDYSEYLILRADLYGWGNSYGAGSWTSEGYDDWDAFRTNMNGADVTITITRNGSVCTVSATATCQNGHTYTETFVADIGNDKDPIRSFLTVDGCYLEMNKNKCGASKPVTVTKTTVGNSDNSSGFWGDHSDYFTIPAGWNLALSFTNYSSTANNWNNWVLGITTDDDREGSNYSEYLILRADLYGWGNSYGAGSWTSEGYDDWDAFRTNMDGAVVNMNIQRNGSVCTVTAKASCQNGHVYTETFTADIDNDSENIRAFLTVDGCHLDMRPAGCLLTKPF